MRRSVISRIISTIAFATVFSAASFLPGNPPNILFIYLDDFGWRDTSYMGSDFYETPHLDAWAAEGVQFHQAYSCAANCAPARACLLSGQYTPRHRVFNVGTRPRGKQRDRKLKHIPGVDTLDPKIKTWAQCLQAAGYRTASIGKWHLSDDPRPYGFDVNVGGTHSGSPPRGYYPPHPGAPGLDTAPADEYLTDRLTHEALKFIRDNRDRPWCLYLTHFAVHTPLDAKRELVEKYKRKPKGKLHHHVKMATMIQAVDDGVGEIRKLLQELKLESNTAVIFFSDNGGYGPATDMAPLRGYKGTYYEGGIRVPLFFVWPGHIEKNRISETPVIGVDLYPTLCSIAGAPPPNEQTLDGVDLVPLLTEQTELADRDLFWHFPAYLQATGANSEARDPIFRTRPCGVIRSGHWKLIHYFEDNGFELYDLEKDLGETQNLAEQAPEALRQLQQKLEAWQTRTNAPIPESR